MASPFARQDTCVCGNCTAPVACVGPQCPQRVTNGSVRHKLANESPGQTWSDLSYNSDSLCRLPTATTAPSARRPRKPQVTIAREARVRRRAHSAHEGGADPRFVLPNPSRPRRAAKPSGVVTDTSELATCQWRCVATTSLVSSSKQASLVSKSLNDSICTAPLMSTSLSSFSLITNDQVDACGRVMYRQCSSRDLYFGPSNA